MTNYRIGAALLLLLAAAGAANAWAQFGVVGDRVQWSTRSSDPAVAQKLTKLFDAPGRVYGETGSFSEIGSWERLYYRGSAQDLHRMIQLAADVPGMEVAVHLSPEVEGPCEVAVRQPESSCEPDLGLPAKLGYDWMMHHFTPDEGSETIDFYVCPSGRATSAQWQLPAGVALNDVETNTGPRSPAEAIAASLRLAAGRLDMSKALAVKAEHTGERWMAGSDRPLQRGQAWVSFGRPRSAKIAAAGRKDINWQYRITFAGDKSKAVPPLPETEPGIDPRQSAAAAEAVTAVLAGRKSAVEVELRVSQAASGKGYLVTITRVPHVPGGHTTVEVGEDLKVLRLHPGR